MSQESNALATCLTEACQKTFELALLKNEPYYLFLIYIYRLLYLNLTAEVPCKVLIHRIISLHHYQYAHLWKYF